MEGRAEIVSRNPLSRPPLRPYEVFVTRRVPLIVYFRRCVKLLRGPYAMAVIRGTGSCIKTAVFLAQDVVASFGGQVVFTCSTTEARQTPDSAAAANPTAAAASGGAAGAATEGGRAAEREETSTAKAVKQKGEAAFVAAASKLAAALGSSSGAAVLSLAAEPSSAQAYDEVVSLGKKHCSEDEEALEAAGIDQELSSFVRQRNISAIKIELRRLSLQ